MVQPEREPVGEAQCLRNNATQWGLTWSEQQPFSWEIATKEETLPSRTIENDPTLGFVHFASGRPICSANTKRSMLTQGCTSQLGARGTRTTQRTKRSGVDSGRGAIRMVQLQISGRGSHQAFKEKEVEMSIRSLPGRVTVAVHNAV